jgi:hypothetical protein
MALEIAGALGFVEASEIAEALDCADKIIAQTVRLMRSGHGRSW